MSDLLTHWAALDDCSRLAALDDRVDPLFRSVLADDLSMARLGTISFGGNSWMQPVLDAVRERMTDPAAEQKNRRNIAFVLGGLVHQAVDNVMKPVLSDAAGMDWNDAHYRMQGKAGYGPITEAEIQKVQEVSAYFDAEVFREVYLGGASDPLNRFFMTRPTAEGARFEEVVFAMFQRALLASHTIKPDADNIEAWLDATAEKVQPFYLRVPEWVKAHEERDPRKLEEYAITSRFYIAADPTITLARKLQAGETASEELENDVFAEGKSICAYGAVLQKGLEYLRNGSAYWQGRADKLDTRNYG